MHTNDHLSPATKQFSFLRYFIIILFFAIPGSFCVAQKSAFKSKKDLLNIIDNNLKDAQRQYRVLASTLTDDRFPKTFFPATGKSETSGSGWWCSGFYPGTLLYLYEKKQRPGIVQ